MDMEVVAASEADVSRIVDIRFSAFENDPYMTALVPDYFAPETRAQAVERMLKKWRENDPTERWVKAVDRETGETAGISNWHIYDRERAETEWKKPNEVDWLEGRQREIAQRFVNVNLSASERYWGGRPHILLSLLCVHQDFQRRGVGTLLLQWGIRLSESTGLSMFLVASPEGRQLYKKLGFHDVEIVVIKAADWDGDYDFPMAIMQRDVQDRSTLAVKGELIAEAK